MLHQYTVCYLFVLSELKYIYGIYKIHIRSIDKCIVYVSKITIVTSSIVFINR